MTGPPTKPAAKPIECQSFLARRWRETALAARDAPLDQFDRIIDEGLMSYLHAGKPTAADRVTAFDGVDRLAIWAEIHDLRAELEDLRKQKAPQPDVGKRSLRGEDAKPTRRQ